MQVRGQLREKDAGMEALQASVDKLEKARRLADKKHLLQLKELNKRCGRGVLQGGAVREAGCLGDRGWEWAEWSMWVGDVQANTFARYTVLVCCSAIGEPAAAQSAAPRLTVEKGITRAATSL